MAKRQAEGQRVLLHQAKDQLAASKQQIITLKKKLEVVEKARDQVEQEGNIVGVAETEETLKTEVSGVCRNYCLQVWNEALNQAGVKSSSKFRRVECAYYPFAIYAPASTSFKVNTLSKVAKLEKDSLKKVLLSSGSPPKEVEQLGVTEKEADMTKGVAPDATKPPTAPQDPSKEKEVSPIIENFLATLPMPTKGDPKGKDQGSLKVAFS